VALPVGRASRREASMIPKDGPTPPFGAPDLEQLTGLVFELASQLHIERVRRIALEVALEHAGVMPPDAAERIAASVKVTERSATALERAMGGIMRVLTEDDDPRTPLRGETHNDR
jgi:hypothetical protein